MIGWLLTRLEANPRAVFLEAELRAYDSTGFEVLRGERLLRRLRVAATYPDPTGRRILSVFEGPDGTLEAIDDADPDFDPLPVTHVELAQWIVDLDRVAARIRAANELQGRVELLTPRLLYLGTAMQSIGVVLAFVPRTSDAETLLLALRVQAPQRAEGPLVLCPSYSPPPTLERQFWPLRVALSTLGDRDPFTLTAPALATLRRLAAGRFEQESRDQSLVFRHSPDFRSVSLRGQQIPLTTQQAQAIEILWHAYENGTSELSQAYVLGQIGSENQELRDTFRRPTDLWGTLVVAGTTRGTVRLNL